MFCGGFKIAAKNQKIPKIQNIMLASWNQDYGHSANFIHTFPFQLIHFPNALWVYPNVNGSVRNFSQDTPPPPPHFFLFNYFRENICVTIWPRFYFLYIFVVRVDRKHQATCFFYIFPSNLQSFGDEIFQNGPRKYLSAWRLKANIWIFQIAFLQWIAPLTKNCFLVFFRAGLHLHVRKILTLSVKQFNFFAKISYILDN